MKYAKITPDGQLIFCNKSDADFAVLSVDEYEKLNADDEVEFRLWMSEIKTQSDCYEKKVKRLEAAIKEKDEEINALKEKVAEEEANVSECRDEINRQKLLNENLLRVNKERANADRKLSPKKTHPGYVLLNSQQVVEKLSDFNQDQEEVTVWKTDLQTPFDATFSFSAITPEIIKDLKERVLGMFGITRICPECHDGSFKTWVSDEENIVYRMRFQANFRAGFWEMSIWHNHALDATNGKEFAGRNTKKRSNNISGSDSAKDDYEEIASSIANARSWLADEIGHSEFNEDDDYDNFDPVDN